MQLIHEITRHIHDFFYQIKIWQLILVLLTCFVQVEDMKLFLFKFADLAEQFQVDNLYNTRKLTKNQLSLTFYVIQEIMNLSPIQVAGRVIFAF